MSDFLDGITGEFIHVNCDIFPITSFMYKDRKVLKTESVYSLEEYVLDMIKKLDVGTLNVELFKKYIDVVTELVINQHGIIRISLKGETNESKTSTE